MAKRVLSAGIFCMGIVCALSLMNCAFAADLEWKYEGTSPQPVTDTEVSGAVVAMDSCMNVSMVSELYGTSEDLLFRSFFNSSYASALNAIFRSSKPIGMWVIFK